jgi:hypothetical protein
MANRAWGPGSANIAARPDHCMRYATAAAITAELAHRHPVCSAQDARRQADSIDHNAKSDFSLIELDAGPGHGFRAQ